MNEFTARAGSLPLVGSELAFDLANTASGRGSPKNLEHFHTPTDVIVWARHAKVITGRDRDAALERIADDPALGRRLLRQVLSSREVIHRIGVAISQGSQPAPADLSALRAMHTRTLAVANLTPFGDGFVWSWNAADGVIEAILGPTTLSALTLLT